MALRWGIVSAGKISYDFANALSTLPQTEHEIVAVAAADKSRAEEFAKVHGIKNAFGSHEELAKSPLVEVAYVGSLNTQHFEIAMMMLQNGKHVLVEKPLCLNEKQAQQLIVYAKSQKLFLMEAVWSRFFPSYQYVREQIGQELLGAVKEVQASLGLNLSSVDRIQKKDLGGGVVLDLGIYPIQLCGWIFEEEPVTIKATGELNEQGVDISVKVELKYTEGRSASFNITAKNELENKAIIKGTKGQITMLTFWCSTSIIDVDGKTKTWPLPKGKVEPNFPNSTGLRYEAEEVRKCIRGKKLESVGMSHRESLILARVEDAIRKQIGVAYTQDR